MRSSFAIEAEIPSVSRTDRLAPAFKAAPDFKPDEASLVQPEADIVEPRYAAGDWR
jgi:hypothetical protein